MSSSGAGAESALALDASAASASTGTTCASSTSATTSGLPAWTMDASFIVMGSSFSVTRGRGRSARGRSILGACADSTAARRASHRRARGHGSRGNASSGRTLAAPPLVLAQQLLPQADARRRDLDELVVVDELERLLEREADRRRQQEVLVRARRADIRELLALRRIHGQVVPAAVDADDHPFVDLVAVADEQRAALLEVEQRIRRR